MEPQEVDFVGGPLDGLTYPLAHSPSRLPAEVRLPVNPSLLEFMVGDGEWGQVDGPATSIAVYRREEDCVPRYCHLASITEEGYADEEH